MAEALTTGEASSRLKGVLNSTTGGKIVKYKIDSQVTIGYMGGSGNFETIDDATMENIVNNTLGGYFKNFLKEYSRTAKQSTSVEKAKKAYTEELKKMYSKIEDIIKDGNLPDKSRQEIYQAFYNTFSVSFSVKDYQLYNNELGVHGGNLGPGSLPEGVINNITELYRLGGISPVDAEKVLIATINSGSDMIGSDIKQHIETYLLGGAALMMFDDNFANTKKFLEETKAKYDELKDNFNKVINNK